MPESHRKHLQWTPGRLLNWALSIGPATRDVVQLATGEPPASRAGLPRLPGAAQPRQALRRGAPGSRLPAGAGHRLAHPQAHQVDPRGQARSAPGAVPAATEPQAHPRPPQHANVRGAEYFRSTTLRRRSRTMLIQPTLDTLNRLKLYGMAAALSEQLTQSAATSLAFDERLGLLVEREVDLPRQSAAHAACCSSRSSRNAPASRTSTSAPAADSIARNSPASPAATGSAPAQNLLIHGATGCGKTFLACALAQQACRQGLSALYLRAPRLFDELSLCHADGSFRKRLAAIAKVDLRPDRRLRHRADRRTRAHRSARTARRSRRHPLHAHHQPASDRALARLHRRSDPRRRHPRPARAQRPQDPSRRRIDAQTQPPPTPTKPPSNQEEN